jgi:hypothetical protein
VGAGFVVTGAVFAEILRAFPYSHPDSKTPILQSPSQSRSALLVQPHHLVAAMADCALNGTLHAQYQGALREAGTTGNPELSWLTGLKATHGADCLAACAEVLNELVASARDSSDLQALKTALTTALSRAEFAQAFINVAAQATQQPGSQAQLSNAARVVATHAAIGPVLDQLFALKGADEMTQPPRHPATPCCKTW